MVRHEFSHSSGFLGRGEVHRFVNVCALGCPIQETKAPHAASVWRWLADRVVEVRHLRSNESLSLCSSRHLHSLVARLKKFCSPGLVSDPLWLT